MSTRFVDWREARAAAQKLADQCGRPAAVRRAVEFGRVAFNVNLAALEDFDRAEIVHPGPRADRGVSDRELSECLNRGVYRPAVQLRFTLDSIARRRGEGGAPCVS